MPSPAPGPTPSDEQALDDILNNIDRLADHVCKKATDRHPSAPREASTPPPTQAFSPERFKKTQLAFQQLSESKLELDDSNGGLPALNNAQEEEEEASAPPTKSRWPWSRTATG